MRVVHLITGLGGGGAERMLLRLVNHGGDGIRHVVVSLQDEGAYGAAMRQAGITVHCLGMRRSLPSPAALWRLVSLLRRERPDVLQTWLYHADLMGLIAGRLAGIRRIVWNLRCSSMEMASYRRSSALVRWALVKLSHLPDLVLANSRAGINDHRALGYHPRAWAYIPNGFDLCEWRPDPAARAGLRRIIGLSEDRPVVGMIARLDPQKDHETFVSAAARVARDRPDVAFLLVGRGVGPDKPPFLAVRGSSALDGRLHFLGESKDVQKLMPGLDLLVLSSAWGEGFPNVVGEAMACGVPCVVTEVGDAAAIVGDTGEAVPVGDAEGLARAMLKMLAIDPDGRRQLGEAARARVARLYSIDGVVAEYSRLYHHLARLGDGKVPCAV